MTKKSSFARKASAKKKSAKSRRPAPGRGQSGNPRRKYAAPRAERRVYAPTAEGIFHGTARGFGFITPDPVGGAVGEDLFVPARFTGGAIDGDRVCYRVQSDTDTRRFGRGEESRTEAAVTEVVAHSVTSLVAEFCVEAHIRGRKTVRRFYAIPENKKPTAFSFIESTSTALVPWM